MSIDKKASYYDMGGIETMEIIKAKLTSDEFNGFLRGNVLKYICRAGIKTDRVEDKIRDLEKAMNYLKILKQQFD